MLNCNSCQSMSSISNGGRADVKSTMATKKNKVSVKAAASSSHVKSFFKNIGTDVALAVAAKEETFAWLAAAHWQNFISSRLHFQVGIKTV